MLFHFMDLLHMHKFIFLPTSRNICRHVSRSQSQFVINNLKLYTCPQNQRIKLLSLLLPHFYLPSCNLYARPETVALHWAGSQRCTNPSSQEGSSWLFKLEDWLDGKSHGRKSFERPRCKWKTIRLMAYIWTKWIVKIRSGMEESRWWNDLLCIIHTKHSRCWNNNKIYEYFQSQPTCTVRTIILCKYNFS